MKRSLVLLLACAGGLGSSLPASAVDLTLDSASGVFTAALSNPSPAAGLGTNEIRFGIPFVAGIPQSGLRFDAAATPDAISTDSSFALGTLTHFNLPLQGGTGAIAATLQLDLGVSNGGSSLQTFLLDFDILETPNQLPCSIHQVSATLCDDVITPKPVDPGSFFTIGGVEYRLLILGFGPTPDALIPRFVTEEVGSRTATLWAELDSTGEPGVPEPHAALLLVMGAGLAGWKRRLRGGVAPL